MLSRLLNSRFQLAAVPIVILIALHFLTLINAPTLYIDEIATSVHTKSILDDGTDFNDNRLPLMSRSFGGGYTTGVYIYPLAAWSSLFGSSDLSIRAFSQFVTISSIGLIAASIYLWLGKRAGYIGLMVGLTLPWAWINGSLAWDPAITPLYIAMGVFFFSLLARRKLSTAQSIALSSLMTASLVLAAYSYPPTRVSAPLLLGGAVLYLKMSRQINWPRILAILVTGALASMPLVTFMLAPDSLERSASLIVFSNSSIIDGIGALLNNIRLLLNPVTLFISGDENLRHSTGYQGMLGFSSLIAIVALGYSLLHKTNRKFIPSNQKYILSLSMFGIIIGLLGSALTSEGQPHYLRATATWPFVIIFLTVAWQSVLKLPSYTRNLLILAGSICLMLYVFDLSINYPSRAESAFESQVRTEREADFLEYYYQNK